MDSIQFILVAGLVAMVAINAASLMWAMRLNRELQARPAPKVYEVKVDAGKVMADIDMTHVEQ